jgi:hypothetical protein
MPPDPPPNDEEARAQLWRAQQARRVAFQLALWNGPLAGSPAALARVNAAYKPLVDWLTDRERPDDDPTDELTFDPLGISDSVNVGRTIE